jgi:hypothetical protein
MLFKIEQDRRNFYNNTAWISHTVNLLFIRRNKQDIWFTYINVVPVVVVQTKLIFAYR